MDKIHTGFTKGYDMMSRIEKVQLKPVHVIVIVIVVLHIIAILVWLFIYLAGSKGKPIFYGSFLISYHSKR